LPAAGSRMDTVIKIISDDRKKQRRSDGVATVRAAPGATCQGRQTGKNCIKKIIHVQIQIITVPACLHEEQKIAIANTSLSASYQRQPN